MPDADRQLPTDPVALLAAVLDRVAALQAPITPEALSPEQAAAFLSISRTKLHEMNSSGLLPAPVEMGDRCPRWVRSELVAWLRAGAPSRVVWLQVRDGAMRRVG